LAGLLTVEEVFVLRLIIQVATVLLHIVHAEFGGVDLVCAEIEVGNVEVVIARRRRCPAASEICSLDDMAPEAVRSVIDTLGQCLRTRVPKVKGAGGGGRSRAECQGEGGQLHCDSEI
jgi:hypothetical protein